MERSTADRTGRSQGRGASATGSMRIQSPVAAGLLAVALVLACGPPPDDSPRGGGAEGPSRAPDTPVARRDASAAPDTLPLRPYVGRLRTLTVEVAGESGAFLFDTGGGRTLVTPEVAERVGCEPAGRSVGFRMSGERVDFALCGEVSLEMQGEPFPHSEVAVFDLMGLLPEGLPTLDGLVSLETFRDLPVTLELAADRLVVETGHSLETRVAGMRELRARWATGSDGSSLVPFVGVDAPGPRMLWFEVDSGNLDAVLLAPHAARLLGLEAPAGHPPDERWEVESVPLSLAEGLTLETPAAVEEILYDGALSAAFLERLVLTMDAGAGRMWGRER